MTLSTSQFQNVWRSDLELCHESRSLLSSFPGCWHTVQLWWIKWCDQLESESRESLHQQHRSSWEQGICCRSVCRLSSLSSAREQEVRTKSTLLQSRVPDFWPAGDGRGSNCLHITLGCVVGGLWQQKWEINFRERSIGAHAQSDSYYVIHNSHMYMYIVHRGHRGVLVPIFTREASPVLQRSRRKLQVENSSPGSDQSLTPLWQRLNVSLLGWSLEYTCSHVFTFPAVC